MKTSPRRRPLRSARPAAASGIVLLALLGGLGASLAGCELPGAMMASAERFEPVPFEAKYTGLEGRSVVVLVDAPSFVQYEHPRAVPVLTDLVSAGIVGFVQPEGYEETSDVIPESPPTRILPAREVLRWQDDNYLWPSMDYGEIAAELGAERLVIVDIIDYRLTEPGNVYLWDGYAAADVGVVEADGPDSSQFVATWRVVSRFPYIDGVTRDDASARDVEDGLQIDFARRIVRLFHDYEVIRDQLRKESRR